MQKAIHKNCGSYLFLIIITTTWTSWKYQFRVMFYTIYLHIIFIWPILCYTKKHVRFIWKIPISFYVLYHLFAYNFYLTNFMLYKKTCTSYLEKINFLLCFFFTFYETICLFCFRVQSLSSIVWGHVTCETLVLTSRSRSL